MRRALALALLAAVAAAGPVHPSIGVCTRKDDFAKRQAAMEKEVLELAGADAAKRKKLAAALAKDAEKDIECLIRYREAHLAPVFAAVLKGSKNWFTRARAAYALKMCGGDEAVPALAAALGDRDGMVREAAASALGHLGGDAARAALEKQREAEKDPYVLATIESALVLAGGERPYGDPLEGETMEGPEGARRVAWAWTVKGASRFNRYDARVVDYPAAERFVYPVQRYKEDLFAGYPRKSFGANGTHAGEDCAWFREGCSLFAIADGVVRMVQGSGGDWGYLIVLEHRLPDGRYMTSVYGHAAFDVLVAPGEIVKCGQRIGTQGLSCSVENGGYGSHLHFGLGDGPFRRPVGLAAGDAVNLDLGDKKVKAPVLRLVYSAEKKNSLGFPLTGFVVHNPDGTERAVDVPEQPLQRELGWFQAYVKDCRGWLDPQTTLPERVEGKSK